MKRLALLAMVAVLAHASRASAAPEGLVIDASGCSEIDAASLRELLALELADVAARWQSAPSPVVELACAGERIAITVRDPVTDKRLAREVPRPAEEPGRERVLALAISQLFLASWTELLLPENEATALPVRPAEETNAARERARRAIATSIAEVRDDEPVARARVSLLGGVRLRDPFVGLTAGAVSLRAGAEIRGRWLVFGQATFEWGDAERDRGAVELLGGSFGAGLGWTSEPIGVIRLESAVAFSASYLHLQGRPASADVEGGIAETVTGEVLFAAGPALDLGDLRVALELQLGFTLVGPTGEVSGEDPVETGGPFVGAALSVSLFRGG